jgi:hypothetical protein
MRLSQAAADDVIIWMMFSLKWLLTRALVLVVLLGCGLLYAVMVMLYWEYSRTHWVPEARWVGFVVFTVLVFGIAVRECRRSWRRTSLWLELIGLLVAHTVVYAAVLTRVEDWRPVYFVPITLAEVPVLLSILFSRGYTHPSPKDRQLRR